MNKSRAQARALLARGRRRLKKPSHATPCSLYRKFRNLARGSPPRGLPALAACGEGDAHSLALQRSPHTIRHRSYLIILHSVECRPLATRVHASVAKLFTARYSQQNGYPPFPRRYSDAFPSVRGYLQRVGPLWCGTLGCLCHAHGHRLSWACDMWAGARGLGEHGRSRAPRAMAPTTRPIAARLLQRSNTSRRGPA